MDEAKEEAGEGAHERHFGGRLVAFAKRRPLVSLGIVAGAAALGGIDLAAGALVGIGAAALAVTPKGRSMRERVVAGTRRFFAPPPNDRGDEPRPSADF